MWYCPLGSVISFAVGWISSWISNLILGEEISGLRDLEPDLFASSLCKKESKHVDKFDIVVLNKYVNSREE